MVRPASRLEHVREYYFSKKLREIAEMNRSGLPVLNLGIGSPDLQPPRVALDHLQRHSRQTDAHRYQSYTGLPELRAAFARWYLRHFGVSLDPEKEVLPLIGSKEGIMHLAMTWLEPGDEVLVPDPGYPAYATASRLAGATVRYYALRPANGWLPELEALEQTDLSRVKLMWINYPHMPTGTPASWTFFEELVAFAKRHRILLVNDNPYSFILNDRPLSILSVAGARDVALELNSLSKSHNMAGWRIGMLAGRADYLREVLRFKSNMDSGMFKPAQLAAAAALDAPEEWYRQLNAEYRHRRRLAEQLLEALGCWFDPQQVGMFVWASVPEDQADGFAFSDEVLHRARVFLTPGGIFGAQGRPWVRVSLCNPPAVWQEAMRRLHEAGLSRRAPASIVHAEKQRAERNS
ncbi:MAG: aminotransferase class I/II-fold pyridoxal phosphate-dependent enzyme [Bacteroidetes bacterium]|nr:MAG: aminotransferase class I/II-fold pyridoxal phosphate-dependent enzyme [Bacteroidota bacterium]